MQIIHAAKHPHIVDICQPAIANGASRRKCVTPSPVDIATRLRSLIKAHGISQAELARRLGISATRLNNYVSGERIPDRQTLDRIGALLGTDADQLTGATESLTTVLGGILATLFRLNGLAPERGALMAEVAVEALRALRSLPDDGDVEVRSRLAAQIAWQQHTAPKPPR